ncbi:MAG: hypothetical protein HOA17_05565, partial [Candidatus Melainabacteria bacterium]|nr:hypothetical protein [Candidatus Melainabacteria bacterium]
MMQRKALIYILLLLVTFCPNRSSATDSGSGFDYFTGNVGIKRISPLSILDVNGSVFISSGLSLYRTTVSTGTIEATKFCTGDGETNCITDFSILGGGNGANFIDELGDAKAGTTDGASIYLGTKAGNGEDASATYSVGIGYKALFDNSTGDTNNVAVGYEALMNNDADNNTAIGFQTAYSNTSATNITAAGYQALYL